MGHETPAAPRCSLAVECYAGYRADERPTALILGGRRVAVREIRDRWLGEDHVYVKTVGEDGAIYLVRHDLREDAWELILFEAPASRRPEEQP